MCESCGCARQAAWAQSKCASCSSDHAQSPHPSHPGCRLLCVLLSLQVVEGELMARQMRALVDMENSGMVPMLQQVRLIWG